MSNSKALREAILKQAGWVFMLQCKLCSRISNPLACNNNQCPYCGGNMKDSAVRWRPKKFKLERRNLALEIASGLNNQTHKERP